MPKYVLYYFDISGRAEPIRLMFHHAGVEFEDHRFKKEEWPEFKKTHEKLIPFGQVPVLEIDGEVLAQSHAISRYVANEFGLNGKTNLEKAKCDMLVDGLSDIGSGLVAIVREQDETRKAAIRKDFFENKLPAGIRLFEEKFIPKEGFMMGESAALRKDFFENKLPAGIRLFEEKCIPKDGFFLGESISRADIHFRGCMDAMTAFEAGVLDNHPVAKALYDRVGNSPNIKKYLESKKK